MNFFQELTSSSLATAETIPIASSLLPQPTGVSLLDAKNELFLSYLQALALRNLSVIKSIKNGQTFSESKDFSERLTKKLVEQRVYLEKGVRPLEQRIKYQIDKVIRATEDEQRSKAQKQQLAENKTRSTKDGVADQEPDKVEKEEGIDELSYRPNPGAFKSAESEPSKQEQSQKDGVYRPPRISAAAMPDPDKREKRDRKLNKSRTLDEYIDNELSAAPITEPSIGSTIIAGGRQTKSARDIASEAERQEYEETHLVRLPAASKKEKARQAKRRSDFGGEDLEGFGDSLSRISDLTRKSKSSVLDKSRKRRAVEDGPRDDGIGGSFEAKRKRIGKRSKR